jgi:hypothetical protein
VIHPNYNSRASFCHHCIKIFLISFILITIMKPKYILDQGLARHGPAHACNPGYVEVKIRRIMV